MTRRQRILSAALVTLVMMPGMVAAQSFAIGPRLTFVRGTAAPEGSQRFSGGFIRLGGGHTALELAMDYRSGITGELTERIKRYPIQASLLVFPIRSRLAPYILGGVGWYSQRIQQLGAGGAVVDEQSTRKMGYHAGFGGELRIHRHVGLYGDYRYTMIRFGSDEAETAANGAAPFPGWIPFAERLKMTHEGSMFTWGASFYF